jgi:hypothetical protein
LLAAAEASTHDPAFVFAALVAGIAASTAESDKVTYTCVGVRYG